MECRLASRWRRALCRGSWTVGEVACRPLSLQVSVGQDSVLLCGLHHSFEHFELLVLVVALVSSLRLLTSVPQGDLARAS
jgi:hypothetical protein